jgi:hypothetical protein
MYCNNLEYLIKGVTLIISILIVEFILWKYNNFYNNWKENTIYTIILAPFFLGGIYLLYIYFMKI